MKMCCGQRSSTQKNLRASSKRTWEAFPRHVERWWRIPSVHPIRAATAIRTQRGWPARAEWHLYGSFLRNDQRAGGAGAARRPARRGCASVSRGRRCGPTVRTGSTLQDWIREAQITAGPLFRPVDRHGCVRKAALGKDAVGAILKRAVGRAGYDPEGLGRHALRAGFATQAARNGATAYDIMRQTGHRSLATVGRYIREAQLFRDSPASKLGL